MGVSISSHRVVSMRHSRSRAALVAAIFFFLILFFCHRQQNFILRRPSEESEVDNDAQDALNFGTPLDQPEHPPNHPDWQRQPPVINPVYSPTEAPPQRQKVPLRYSHTPDCSIDRSHLVNLGSRFGLGPEFEYMKRYVEFSREPIQRKRMTDIDGELLGGDFTAINLATKHRFPSQKCPVPLHVAVPDSPLPSTANLSDFMFGISTKYDRVMGSTRAFDEWSYWLTDGRGNSNGGKLVLLLLDATDLELETVGTELRRIGVNADVLRSDSSEEMAVRYLSTIPRMYENQARNTRKWLVMCDDDTFFPYINGLVEKLDDFDPSKKYYVGALSEDAMSLQRHGSEAYGGAGIFITMPLARDITENFMSCRSPEAVQGANSGWGAQGDLLVRNCIYTYTDVRLTEIWDLWQMDLMADIGGFFESGIKPLSMHHYSGEWYRAAPYDMTKLSHTCGEDCSLLRFRTADDFVISSGWSVGWYPDGTEDINWDQMERTFAPIPPDQGWNFDYKLGPQRPSLLMTGKKMSWEMKEANVADDGSVTQIYVRRQDDWRWVELDGEPMADQNSILELIWIPAGKTKKTSAWI